MIFGEIPVAEAEGLILAHSVRLPKGAFKKGRILSAEDIELLRSGGVTNVSGARLEADDIGEDGAALALAQTLAGPGLALGKAFTGRCNLFATERGLVIPDTARIDRINLIDEGMTVGTLAPYSQVEPGQMVATVKVIPFALPRAIVDGCLAIAREGGDMVRVAPFRGRRVGFIQTRLPGTKESVLDSTTGTLLGRLAILDGELASEIRCAHSSHEIAEAVRRLAGLGCDMILIAGASAIVDRRDIVPSGIVEAGGEIDHFGMPVDPGNLLLSAHLGEIDVLGLPGCARSLKLNGFDWVLRRRFADIPVTRHDIMTMGAGGLLMEISSRPLPRAFASPKDPTALPEDRHESGTTKIAAIVLAAGQSRRMGDINKLLVKVDGTAMVARAVDAALASGADPVIVVTGHERERIEQVLAGRAAEILHNPDFAEGMSTSVRAGLNALPADSAAALICLGDMPHVDAALISRLIEGFDPARGHAICVPTYKGKRGNPVLWAARYFPAMKNLSGDVGARHLIGEHSDAVREIECGDPAVTFDVDTPEALKSLNKAAEAD
ncbi:MAG: NTP transferase domain-containing protein [Rhodospirillaceae bacterium]|nr:NTP transferase domain-containing protein [Rhodospirillaceae bacterium]MBT5037657.1 NTP transferase domain-containing protein [Rhodospirillaceae bacterium]